MVSLAALGAIIAASVGLIAIALNFAQFYIPADAGHYLADADAMIGRGVRENRHPPLFPLLVSLIRLVVRDDLTTIRVTVAISMALLVVSFFIFIRGRTGSTLGDVAATGLFAFAPTNAELVGWFGGSSLIGIAMCLVALRLISDLVATPTLIRSIAAGAAVAGVVLSHPFSAGFLGEVALAYITFLLIASVFRSRSLSISWKALFRRACLLLVTAFGGLLAVLVARDFYAGIQNPFVLAPSVQQLSLIWTWAFREQPVMWLSLLVGSLFVIPVGRLTAGERGLDLGLSVTALNTAILGNVVLLQGIPAYATRSLYFAPVVMAAAFGVGLTALIQITSLIRPSFRTLAAFAPAALAALVGALAIQSFAYRLEIVVPYYTYVDPQEFAAIQYLAGRSGTVVLTSKGVILNRGLEYSWLIEGLDRERAIGSGIFPAILSSADLQETNAAERFAAGAAVVEDGRLRVAIDGTQQSQVRVFGNVNGTWYHLFDLGPHGAGLGPSKISTKLTPSGGEIMSSTNSTDAPATVLLASTDHTLQIHFPANQLASDGEVEISPAPGSNCSLDLCPTTPGVQPMLSGSNIQWVSSFEGLPIRITVSPSNAVEASVDAITTPNGVALRSLSPNQGLSIDVNVAGLTGRAIDVMTFDQVELIRDQAIRYLWSWKSDQAVARYAGRSCLSLAYENDEVAIFRVDPNCHA